MTSQFLTVRASRNTEADLLSAAVRTNPSPLMAARLSRQIHFRLPHFRKSSNHLIRHSSLPCLPAEQLYLWGAPSSGSPPYEFTARIPRAGGGPLRFFLALQEQLHQLMRLWLNKFLSKAPYKELGGLELHIIPSIFLFGMMLLLLLITIQPKL